MKCKKSGVIAKILNLELNNRDSRYASSVCILGVKKANPWVGLYNLCSKQILFFIFCLSDFKFQLYLNLTVQTDFGLVLTQDLNCSP